jgi:ABC-type phosphate transport system substrate-binding protein
MLNTAAKAIYSRHLGKVAVALLLVVGLTFLVGCQGFSSGKVASQQLPSGTLSLSGATLDFGSVTAGVAHSISEHYNADKRN